MARALRCVQGEGVVFSTGIFASLARTRVLSNHLRAPLHQTFMPYVTGEHPEAGDQISHRFGRIGIVTHVLMWGSSRLELVIGWEDGTVGIQYLTPEDFELVNRRDGKELAFPAQ